MNLSACSLIIASRHVRYVSLYVCPSSDMYRPFLISFLDDSVIKSRLQAGSNKYKSSLDGLLTILREEGFLSLYKGINSKIIQSVLTAAILFAGQRRIFEVTKKVLVFSFLLSMR